MLPTFLLSSRLGLLHEPQGQAEKNVGVELGPEAIITEDFVRELELRRHYATFSEPETVQPQDYFSVFEKETQAAIEHILSALKSVTTSQPSSIAIGGDHSVGLAHISAVLQTVKEPAKTGVLMIDSHADINLFSTSPTGNMHGMWLRPIIDAFDDERINRLVPQKMLPKNLVYIGNLDLDPAEQEYIKKNGIHVFSVDEVRQEQERVLQFLKTWFASLTHLHLSFDIDSMDRSVAPATGIPCPAGFLPDDLWDIFSVIKKHPRWSMDLVEVNPTKEGGQQTVALAQEILRFLLKS
jgi:arginase